MKQGATSILENNNQILSIDDHALMATYHKGNQSASNCLDIFMIIIPAESRENQSLDEIFQVNTFLGISPLGINHGKTGYHLTFSLTSSCSENNGIIEQNTGVYKPFTLTTSSSYKGATVRTTETENNDTELQIHFTK